jgi:hypothetical protein
LRSTCDDLENAAPKAMAFDYWRVWGSEPLERYASCEVGWARAHYLECPVGDVRVYVRPDLADAATTILRTLDIPDTCRGPGPIIETPTRSRSP